MGKPVKTSLRATGRLPMVVDAGSGQLDPAPRRRRAKYVKLTTIIEVADELARLYRQARGGLVPPADASRFAYMLNTLAGLIELGELERRLDALEQSQSELLEELE